MLTASLAVLCGLLLLVLLVQRPTAWLLLAVSISSVHLGLRFIGFLPPQTLHRLAVRPDQTSIRIGRIIGLRLVRR